MAEKAMVDMNAGQRNKRVTLQAPTKVPDNMGGSTVTWTDLVTVWASMRFPNYREMERITNAKLETQVTHVCTMPYRRGIRNSWRLKMDGRYFNILYTVNPSEANVELQIWCRETQQ